MEVYDELVSRASVCTEARSASRQVLDCIKEFCLLFSEEGTLFLFLFVCLFGFFRRTTEVLDHNENCILHPYVDLIA